MDIATKIMLALIYLGETYRGSAEVQPRMG